MFQLNDQFLADIGLNDMPDDQKKPFLQYIYDTLEMRVGTRLSEALSDQQLEQFEKIIDRDQATVDSWIAQFAPNYQQDPNFTRLQAASGLDANDLGLRAEYVASRWLEANSPNYRAIVQQVLDELKREIISNRDAILGGNQAA